MAPIEVMELPDLILQMKNSGSFYIELVLDEQPLTTRAEVNIFFRVFTMANVTSFLLGDQKFHRKFGPQQHIR